MSSQSCTDGCNILLMTIQKQLYRFSGPFLMIFGSISCILALIVFTRQNLRKNPCSIYFVAYNISNLLYIYSSIFTSTLFYGYNVQLTLLNLVLCRLVYYMGFLFDMLSPFYLILASIDRILITSRNALTRRRSTRRLAYICVSIGTLFWMLFHTHSLFFTNILQLTTNYSICYFQSGLYTVLMGYYSLLIKGLLIPILLIFFGVWTLKNVRGARMIRAVQVFSTNRQTGVARFRPIPLKDRQLISMLLIDILIYICFNGMLSIVVVYQQITSETHLTVQQTQVNLFVRNVSVFLTYIQFCIGSCGYLLVSKTFRNEFKKIFLCR